MAFKGKALIDATRLKADIFKIQKIETAFNIYYSKYNVLRGVEGSGEEFPGKMSTNSIYKELIKDNLLKPTDFMMTSAPGTYWHFFGCKDYPSDNDSYWTKVDMSPANGICIYRSDNPQGQRSGDWPDPDAQKSSMNNYEVYNIENLLDDKNTRSGDGRAIDPSIAEQKSAYIDVHHNEASAYECSRYEDQKMN